MPYEENEASQGTLRIMTIVVCAVLDLAFIGLFAYGLKRTKDLTETELKAEDAKIAQFREGIRGHLSAFREYTEPIGWRGMSASSTDRLPTAGFAAQEIVSYSQSLKGYLNRWVKELKQVHQQDASSWTEQAQGITLVKLIEMLENVRNKYSDERIQLESQTKGDLTAAKASVEKGVGEAEAVFKAMTGATGVIPKIKNQIEVAGAEEMKLLEEISRVEVEYREKSEKFAGERQKMAKEKEQKERKVAELEERFKIQRAARAEALERRDEDGRVLSVDLRVQVVTVDLTLRDKVLRGTRFKVFGIEKGGLKLDRGEIEIIEVGQTVSKAVVVQSIAEQQIQEGDRFYNEYFERGAPKFFSFAGRFRGKYSEEDMIAKAKEMGDRFQRDVDGRTTLCVVGEGFETHPNFAAAKEMGVRIMAEKAFYEYLGLP